jgi:hypothetical protein
VEAEAEAEAEVGVEAEAKAEKGGRRESLVVLIYLSRSCLGLHRKQRDFFF